MKLPAVIAVALVPIAPGKDAPALPAIASETAVGRTTWRLPVGDKTVRIIADTQARAVEGKGAP